MERYDLIMYTMKESKDGTYVFYSDIAHQQALIEELCEALEDVILEEDERRPCIEYANKVLAKAEKGKE